jgi:hypothetical protein
MLAAPEPSTPRRAAACLLVLLALASVVHGHQIDLEAAVKATFVIRFVSFVQWPAGSFTSPDDPLRICVAGDDSFAALVESAAQGESAGPRSLLIQRFAALPADATCHILYAAGAPGQSVPQMLAAVRARPVLTVTDEARGRTQGIVHFVLAGGRVRFRINREEAELAQLAMSARLLSVALSVSSSRPS